MLPSADVIAERLAKVRTQIAGRGVDPDAVTVVGVTKSFPSELAHLAIEAGLRDLGENYGQELEAKAKALDASALDGDELRWHFIGGLQRNKVKVLAPYVSLWHTIDRQPLIVEVAKRAPGAKILIQVNTTSEPQKSGCDPADASRLVDSARELGLEPIGLMTIGPTNGSNPGPCFELLARLADTLALEVLSMGMSGDYEQAVGAGATMIRIGSALFGDRALHQSPR